MLKKKSKGKSSNGPKKGRTLTQDEFEQFKQEVKDDEIDDLWSNPGDWETDDDSDSDEFNKDLVDLDKKGNTKSLFRSNFMDKLHEYLADDVLAKHGELGPFQYRKKDYNAMKLDESKLEVRNPTKLEDDSYYFGQWIQGTDERCGRGFQVTEEGELYEGFWSKNKKNGKGRTLFINRDVFQGTYKNGQPEGYGCFVKDKDVKTKGYYKKDKLNGKGFEMLPDGTTYRGDFKNGEKEGEGTFKWEGGQSYTGEVINGKLQGKGTYTWTDGRTYTGDFKDSKMDGEGIFKFSDGKQYEGEYKNDKKHGHGVYTWPEGKKYDGGWKNGKQHGEGIYTTKEGKVKKGLWEDGEKIKWIS